MGTNNIPVSLASDSTTSFYSALSQISSLSGAELEVVLPNALANLSRSPTLPERRKGERASALLARVRLAPALAGTLARAYPGYSPAIRNALAQALPATLRWNLERQEDPTPSVPEVVRPGESADLQPDDDSYSASTEQLSLPVDVVKAEQGEATVLLLSASQDQEGNVGLLRKSGFAVLHFSSWDSAQTDMAAMSDICAYIVDGSFIRGMDAVEQLVFFERLASYSTLSWIRIDESGLNIRLHDVRECIRKARLSLAPLPADAISFQADGRLRESELPDIARAKDLLHTHASVRLQPRELTDTEGQLLIAAIRKSYEENRFDRSLEISTLEVEFLAGGFSGARTALLRIPGNSRGEIAKIDSRDRISEEIARFYEFIQPWDPELQPRAFFHGNAALILFGIIPDESNPTRPAEMLETRLQHFWNEEIFATHNEQFTALTHRAHNLGVALKNVADKLYLLNRRRSETDRFAPHGYPDPSILSRLDERGIRWGLAGETAVATSRAKERFDELRTVALIHGDLHLGNILVRGDRDPHLIDYASSGPGHPAVDLVRLELALFVGMVRQLASEQRCTEFQVALSVDRKDFRDLERDFPDLHCCFTNRVCIQGCTAARDAAIRTVREHGGTEDDYLAAKYLVALQNLLLHKRQNSLARSVIDALTPVFTA